ncbi:adenylate cyclase [Fictibacillus macauensis ZFHKF-1]|uniref:Adenylate cyclase n=1 Tax=Fictibacillus macauensis ZFHKF-1 TaxID=1196324 RepID=I8IYQ3_9BACL|nr:CYTH domain-containing protein [Fictibacillus macauensis]EIT84606.1 adenylate cyclase [Fictibacillus macauensis ZFHKF-1]
MSQELEIEFKNILTPDEFFRLLNELSLTEDSFVTQVNDYFDTESFALKERQSALRIRHKLDRYTLTLKEPHPDGILETHQSLSSYEMQQFKEQQQLPEGDVKTALLQYGVVIDQLNHLGSLTTKRAELPWRSGLLVLDENQYLTITDYELEFEAKEYHKGKQHFEELLQHFSITTRPTLTKIQRFFEAATLL